MQDKEPEEFRENTSIFQIWLLFRNHCIVQLLFINVVNSDRTLQQLDSALF